MELIKLKVTAYKDAKCTQEVDTIDAFINPESYTHSVNAKFQSIDSIGSSAPTLLFTGLNDESLKLGKIIVDGTGVLNINNSFPQTNVSAYVDRFRKLTCEYNGDIHRTNFLKVVWNKLSFICICKSFVVNYKLFKPDGTPLRAEITLDLSRTEDLSTKAKKAHANSPDLTHVRIFKAGDSLPLMCYRIYGDCSYYLDVARKNKLDNFQDIKPGTPIYFHPLK